MHDSSNWIQIFSSNSVDCQAVHRFGGQKNSSMLGLVTGNNQSSALNRNGYVPIFQ